MCRSSQSFNILSGNPWAFELLKIGLIKFPPPSPPSRPKLCSNGPPKSWIDDPFFCKIQNQGRSSEPLPRESKLFTFKHVHFQDEALVFHRKDFTLPVQNFIPARQSSNCPIPFPPRHVRQSNAREDVEALNWSAHNWLLSKPLISTVFFHEVTLFLLTMCTIVCFPSSSDQSKSPCFLSSL